MVLAEVDVTRKRWREIIPIPADRPKLHDDPLLSELLYRRHITSPAEAADFLDPRERPAPDPFGLPNMERAVARVEQAIANGERIGIFGDYDADGITATALLVRALRGAVRHPDDVRFRLPRRSEGYGLNEVGISELADAGANLLLAVDCGSTNTTEVAFARSLGLDVVILDHHQMSDTGPAEAIVVSAKLPGARAEPYENLSAVGVAYLLAVGLAREGVLGEGADPEHTLLDLVALGTIGDVCKVTGLNRHLVRDGLRRLRERPRLGLLALCRRARLTSSLVNSGDVGFKLVPRLNSAGRMGDPRLAIDLLLTEDRREAERLADQLEALNEERKLKGQEIVSEAEALLMARSDLDSRGLLIVAGDGWSGGVLGIAAAKLTERFGRPVIVLSRDGETSRGSARSIPGVDIYSALAASSSLLYEHGGHSEAAGLSLATANIAALEARLSETVLAGKVPLPLAAELQPDVELDPARLALPTARLLQILEPHGPGNEAPLFLVRNVRVRQYTLVGQERTHLKLLIEAGRSVVPVMVWRAAERTRELVAEPWVDLMVRLRVDHWDGQERLEVVAEDFRPAA